MRSSHFFPRDGGALSLLRIFHASSSFPFFSKDEEFLLKTHGIIVRLKFQHKSKKFKIPMPNPLNLCLFLQREWKMQNPFMRIALSFFLTKHWLKVLFFAHNHPGMRCTASDCTSKSFLTFPRSCNAKHAMDRKCHLR